MNRELDLKKVEQSFRVHGVEAEEVFYAISAQYLILHDISLHYGDNE